MTRQITTMHPPTRLRGLRVALLILGLWSLPTSAPAQVAAPAGAVVPPGTVAAPPPMAAVDPVPVDTYTYEPSGRRDPFVNPFAGSQAQATPVVDARHIDGAAGLSVSEVSVSGVMTSRGALIALVQGASKRTLVVHQGDNLRDGTIKAVVPEGLVIVQPVNDPLSPVKQREVRKFLRSIEDGKQ
jgi:Tfp pilus assembly protein PilP